MAQLLFQPNINAKCYVIVYVDDFKIAGPKDNIEEAWRLIRAENTRTGEKGIVLDEPTPAGKFLGCNHACSEIWAPPMSGDQILEKNLATEDEYDNDTTPLNATQSATEEGAQTTAGTLIKCEQINDEMSDFLGSCVRLYQDLTDARNVPLKSAHTPFVDETGDDYGLGAGISEDAVDGSLAKDACVDMERTFQELAQNACVGPERSGYFTYRCNFDDVEDSHAAIYGDLDKRRLPYSENRMEGAVPLEFVRIPRAGGISVPATSSGAPRPTKTETH
jgi:hypothetical protein